MTKVLLINNDSDTWQELQDACRDAGYEFATLHCKAVKADSATGFDVVILSGGWWYDDEIQHLETYDGEMELIRHTGVPILGICMGMQLMQLAFSGQVPLLDSPQRDLQPIAINRRGQELLGLPEAILVHKNHTMGVIAVAPGFEVLGRSPGHIEIICHAKKPLLGVQFHPEIGEPNSRAMMMRNLIESTMALKKKKHEDFVTKTDRELTAAA